MSEPSSAVIAEVAAALRTLEQRSRWERTLAIGKLILESFFGGSEALWRDRRRNKSESIRKLAARPDCPYAKSVLTEAVAVYLLCQKCPDLKRSGRITPTHVAKVTAFEPQQAERLIRTAEEQSWSVRQIASAASELRRNDGERRGRPRSSCEQRAETWVKRAEAALTNMQHEIEGASTLDDQACSALLERCTSLEQSARNVRRTIEAKRERTERPSGVIKVEAPVPLQAERAVGS